MNNAEEYNLSLIQNVKYTNNLWENHTHVGYILPNVKYRKDENTFYFQFENKTKFLVEEKDEVNLNNFQRNNFLTIKIKEESEYIIYRIPYHIFREERNDGVFCLVGLPENLYLNKFEMKMLGKCVEMHFLKIDHWKIFNISRMIYHYYEEKDKENIESENIDFENENIVSEKIQKRTALIESIRKKANLL